MSLDKTNKNYFNVEAVNQKPINFHAFFSRIQKESENLWMKITENKFAFLFYEWTDFFTTFDLNCLQIGRELTNKISKQETVSTCFEAIKSTIIECE